MSWSTIVLMVSFSSRISPRTSTVILRDRSPRATAVVTSAMLRTWSVRLPHIALTESVRSFHVPATPGTTAWPPSLPSVPTSRATRVTSEANERSWSTIVLMASLSCRISPRTSTVIFFDRSPLATAMVTSAMLRTCAVRLLAIELTLSVRSFQTPLTSRTCAWPPSLPSVPTSRATRVTSEVNTPSCLIIVLTMVAERRNSPSSGRPSTSSAHGLQQVALRDRGDRARHLGGRPQQVVDQRVDRRLHLAPGAARAGRTSTRWRVLPCLPTTWPTRSSSAAIRPFAATMSLKRVGDLALEARPVAGEPDREVAIAHRLKGMEQLAKVWGFRTAEGGRRGRVQLAAILGLSLHARVSRGLRSAGPRDLRR